jgi:hypothetical protein
MKKSEYLKMKLLFLELILKQIVVSPEILMDLNIFKNNPFSFFLNNNNYKFLGRYLNKLQNKNIIKFVFCNLFNYS